MVKEWIQKHGKSLLIIAGTVIVERGINWMIDTAPQVGNSIFSTLTNFIYASAAQHTDSLIMMCFWCYFLGLPFGICLFTIGKTLSGYRRDAALKKAMEHMTAENQKAFFNSTDKNVFTEFYNRSEFKAIEKSISKRSKIIKMIILDSCLIIITCLLLVTMLFYPSGLLHEFERDITAIHPYVEDHKILELKSDWVQMRGKDDYVQIYEVINSVKQEFDLK